MEGSGSRHQGGEYMNLAKRIAHSKHMQAQLGHISRHIVGMTDSLRMCLFFG